MPSDTHKAQFDVDKYMLKCLARIYAFNATSVHSLCILILVALRVSVKSNLKIKDALVATLLLHLLYVAKKLRGRARRSLEKVRIKNLLRMTVNLQRDCQESHG